MNTTLSHQSPESLGIASDAIRRFLETAVTEQFGLHAVILLRHGHTALECSFAPYRPDQVHILYSLSKSFTSTAVGFAVQEGLLSLDDKLVDFFADKLQCEPCGYMKQVTLRHLLTMNSGHSVEPNATESGDWVHDFITSYIDHQPGTLFTYNTGGTFIISAIVQKATGQTVSDYLLPRLFDPLVFSSDTCWEQSPDGIDCGGFGLNITIRDLAKFGQFYLQRGMWEGKQLLSADWIDLATSKQTDNYGKLDWGQGYGFQFWRCQPEGIYRGDGAFGQYCVVMPKQDAVLVINSSVQDMQKTLTAVWDILLPAMADKPLPENEAAANALQAYAAARTSPMPTACDTHIPTLQINGVTFHFCDNPMQIVSLTPQFGEKEDILSFETADGRFVCTVKPGSFTENILPQKEPTNSTPAAVNNHHVESLYASRQAVGAWVDSATYRLILYGTHCTDVNTITLTFLPNRGIVTAHLSQSGSFWSYEADSIGIA